ncbi:RloB domain-containing protein [Paenibacillus agricola]|uniref:RloB domain-containing protein n=1 Tax=Paenibacillus agricola TaxID=2716264 RepID=A0ABX0JGD0_9BACL|nr:RloB domain-containing protein [Paenibacillus agricola]
MTNTEGKQIKYHLGYSNLTFELWMVLHKEDCNAHVEHRSLYLRNINSAFDEDFTELKTYKQEGNFKRILRKLTLNDVKEAIRRANRIMQRHEENGVRPHEYRGFKYIRENPSLTVHESVAMILQDCGLL